MTVHLFQFCFADAEMLLLVHFYWSRQRCLQSQLKWLTRSPITPVAQCKSYSYMFRCDFGVPYDLRLTFITIHFCTFRFPSTGFLPCCFPTVWRATACTYCKWTAARFDFCIQPGLGTCGHDASQQFGERLLVHILQMDGCTFRLLLHPCRDWGPVAETLPERLLVSRCLVFRQQRVYC